MSQAISISKKLPIFKLVTTIVTLNVTLLAQAQLPVPPVPNPQLLKIEEKLDTTNTNLKNINNQTTTLINAINQLQAGYGLNNQSSGPVTSLLCNSATGITQAQSANNCPDGIYYAVIANILNDLLPQNQQQDANQLSLLAPNPGIKNSNDNKGQPTTMTGVGISTLLTSNDNSVSDILRNTTAIQVPLVPYDPKKAYLQSMYAGIFGGATTSNNYPSTKPLSFDSLIVPLMYDTKQQGNGYSQQQDATYFIQFLTGLSHPTSVIDFSAIDKKLITRQLNNYQVQNYLATLRTIAAIYSVSMSNLYFLYAERLPLSVPNQNPPSGVTLPANLQKNSSQLAVDQYMATRRFTDPTWQAEIDAASPTELQRQQLYLLREIRYELFLSRMANERVLATLSSMQIQNLDSLQMKLNSAMRGLCEHEPFKGSTACPSSVTQPSMSNATLP